MWKQGKKKTYIKRTERFGKGRGADAKGVRVWNEKNLSWKV